MKSHLAIPVFVSKDQADAVVGGPASVQTSVKARLAEGVSELAIDENSLTKCIESARAVMLVMEQQPKQDEPQLVMDSVSFQLGISVTGKVGFLGTGVDLQLSAVLTVNLKKKES